jgi:hypothetical protein
MAQEATPTDPAENEERGSRADLALLVAALGGGPGDRGESGVPQGFARGRTREETLGEPQAEAA